uniref:Uncharacterized protein n=1 Tax=Herelleviridae sp. cttEB8 TaxID=2825832 RepID=A0A8S5P875_9CAUD|nr:MAG TPA: hypothetical protein [Herelleviridae sp. cttEB8]
MNHKTHSIERMFYISLPIITISNIRNDTGK